MRITAEDLPTRIKFIDPEEWRKKFIKSDIKDKEKTLVKIIDDFYTEDQEGKREAENEFFKDWLDQKSNHVVHELLDWEANYFGIITADVLFLKQNHKNSRLVNTYYEFILEALNLTYPRSIEIESSITFGSPITIPIAPIHEKKDASKPQHYQNHIFSGLGLWPLSEVKQSTELLFLQSLIQHGEENNDGATKTTNSLTRRGLQKSTKSQKSRKFSQDSRESRK